MSQCFLQVEDRPALPQIINRKRMPKRMNGTRHSRKAKPLAKRLEVPKHVAAHKPAAVRSRKKVQVFMLATPDLKCLAKRIRKYNNPLLIAFTLDSKNHVVEVKFGTRKP